MAVAGGLDLHRGQLTFDYVDLGTGESLRGRISPADRDSLREWLRRFDGAQDVDFAASYQAIARRRGKKIATTAIARKLLTRACHLLTDASSDGAPS